MSDLYDVLAVNIETRKARILERAQDEANADAVLKFAVMRRGVTEEFYVTVLSGRYNDGDTYP